MVKDFLIKNKRNLCKIDYINGEEKMLGKVSSINGLVVDVEFDNYIPKLLEKLVCFKNRKRYFLSIS